MTRHAAFLRGVNLGKRQVKSAELRAVFEALGFTDAKTLLASGNVLFDADAEAGLQARIEAGLKQQFGFEVGTVLRSVDELRALVTQRPFGDRTEGEDAKLYVLLFAEELPEGLQLTGVAGDHDVVRITAREVFVVAHRKPNGRYSEGMEQLDKQLPKGRLVTTRNWNTVLKAAA